jgi:hypothetical protein
MADDTPTAEETTNRASGLIDDPVAMIEDNIVRRLVRVAVHVRGYAPYYLATVAFGVMLLIVPGLGGTSTPGAVASGVTRDPAGATTTTPRASSAAVPSAPAELASADDFFPTVTTESVRSTTGSNYSFDDYDYDTGNGGSSGSPASEGDDPEKPCYLAPPAGAPVSPVSPEREARNAQNTLENAAGQEGPAEASDTVKTGVEATGQCDGESTQSVPDVPAVPTTGATSLNDDAVVELVGVMFAI